MPKIDRVETHVCHTFTFEEIAAALGLRGRIVYLQAELHENPLRFKGDAQIHVVEPEQGQCPICGSEQGQPHGAGIHYIATVKPRGGA